MNELKGSRTLVRTVFIATLILTCMSINQLVAKERPCNKGEDAKPYMYPVYGSTYVVRISNLTDNEIPVVLIDEESKKEKKAEIKPYDDIYYSIEFASKIRTKKWSVKVPDTDIIVPITLHHDAMILKGESEVIHGNLKVHCYLNNRYGRGDSRSLTILIEDHEDVA